MIQAEVLPAPELEPCVDGMSKWEQECSAYWRLLPTLVSQYRDQYVAIHEGQVVDSGANQAELALQVYRRFGYVPIYVGLVSDEPRRMLRVPPREFLERPVEYDSIQLQPASYASGTHCACHRPAVASQSRDCVASGAQLHRLRGRDPEGAVCGQTSGDRGGTRPGRVASHDRPDPTRRNTRSWRTIAVSTSTAGSPGTKVKPQKRRLETHNAPLIPSVKSGVAICESDSLAAFTHSASIALTPVSAACCITLAALERVARG